jgi:3-deoxy-D-manno-octulosonic-acid transferase
MRLLYSLLMVLVQPLLRRKLARRALAEPLYGLDVEQRFGFYKFATWARSSDDAPVVWLHAVSLGETRAAGVLLAHLRDLIPGMRLVLTHGTATGREAGRGLLREGDVQVWQPWDTPASVSRFLAHFQPDVGLLMETEVWPHWVSGCGRAGVPLCLVNARMSDKTWRQSKRLRWLAQPAYAGLSTVWAQSDSDALRLRTLGAPVQGVLGNLKFDATIDADLLSRGRAWRADTSRPVLMFASSREGEEQLLLDAWTKVLQLPAEEAQDFPEQLAGGKPAESVQLLVVPRHPQRFAEVEALFRSAGLSVSRRSAWGEAPQTADVWLGDSLGEMALYFGMADAALLGGSFEPLGGQNLIEAAASGVPVFMGPHVFNFAEASALACGAGAAVPCVDMTEALRRALRALRQPERLAVMREAALGLGAVHRGAAQKTATEVAAIVRRRRSVG